MKIRKAVLTAAGRAQRHLPLQSVIDAEGYPRSACRVFIDELASAGIEEVALIICPGDEHLYREALAECAPELVFIPQTEARGYGHAVLCAADFVGKESFLLTVGDHLYLSDDSERSCARQLVDLAAQHRSPISAVQSTHESKLAYFGTIGGRPRNDGSGLIQIERVREKPTPTLAEVELLIPGQRAGFYLCFFGMHALSPDIMDILREQFAQLPADANLSLSPALEALAHAREFLATTLQGRRYDLGQPYGLLMAQLALALEGADRDTVLAHLVELLAQSAS